MVVRCAFSVQRATCHATLPRPCGKGPGALWGLGECFSVGERPKKIKCSAFPHILCCLERTVMHCNAPYALYACVHPHPIPPKAVLSHVSLSSRVKKTEAAVSIGYNNTMHVPCVIGQGRAIPCPCAQGKAITCACIGQGHPMSVCAGQGHRTCVRRAGPSHVHAQGRAIPCLCAQGRAIACVCAGQSHRTCMRRAGPSHVCVRRAGPSHVCAHAQGRAIARVCAGQGHRTYMRRAGPSHVHAQGRAIA